MSITNESKILITGGTGSFGKAFLSAILKKFPNIPERGDLDLSLVKQSVFFCV